MKSEAMVNGLVELLINGRSLGAPSDAYMNFSNTFNNRVAKPAAPIGSMPVMAPAYENMTILARVMGHERLMRMFQRQAAEKRRIYEGTLLHSLKNMQNQAEMAQIA